MTISPLAKDPTHVHMVEARCWPSDVRWCGDCAAIVAWSAERGAWVTA